MEVSPRLERVRVPDTFPRERVVLGELHLLRTRLDDLLGEVAAVIERSPEPEEGWLRVEEAARLARRALSAAASAVPAHAVAVAQPGELRVGELRVDPVSRRQWYGEAEFELTPLHQRLLAVMAAEPLRVFAKDELAAAVWGSHAADRANAAKMAVGRVRRRSCSLARLVARSWSLSTASAGRSPGRPNPFWRSLVDAIFEAYLVAQRRRRSSALTLKTVEHTLRAAQRWLDEQEIAAAELSLLECEQYFDWLLERGAVATARRQLAYLRAAYRYGIRHGLLERDPTVDVKLPRLPDREPQTYSNEELRAIHAAIRCEREEVAFYLFAFAGLRLGEVAALAWERADLERWQLRLTGKGGKFRLVPLHPTLNDVLHEHRARTPRQERVLSRIDGGQLSSNSLGRVVRTLVDRAGVEIDSPSHAFRRTVATVMYEHGVRTRVIERIMGWSPRQMRERHYLRVADEPMHEAIQTLYREDPICDRQQRTLRPVADATPDAAPTAWLAAESARLEALEQRLGLRAS